MTEKFKVLLNFLKKRPSRMNDCLADTPKTIYLIAIWYREKWVRECVCVFIAQSCPTLCNPMDCSPPGSSVHEIFQARILEWVTISFSRGSSQPRDRTLVSWTAGKFSTNWATREDQERETERIYKEGKNPKFLLQSLKKNNWPELYHCLG